MFAHSAAPSLRAHGRVSLSEIDAAVAARLGPGRVPGNAQPAAFSRQVGMYLASQVCGWSTTRIGKFYNGRDHSTVCYAVARIRALRESDPEVDGLLSVLSSELRDRMTARQKEDAGAKAVSTPRTATPLLHETVLDAIAERIAKRLLATLGSSVQGRPGPLPLQDGNLLAKGENFESDLSAALEEDTGGGNQGRKNGSTDSSF